MGSRNVYILYLSDVNAKRIYSYIYTQHLCVFSGTCWWLSGWVWVGGVGK